MDFKVRDLLFISIIYLISIRNIQNREKIINTIIGNLLRYLSLITKFCFKISKIVDSIF